MPDRISKMDPAQAKELLDAAFDYSTRDSLTVQILRQISDQLTGVSESMRKVNEASSALAERVAKLEAHNIEEIAKKLRELEDERMRRRGVTSVFQWFAEHWPFAAMLAAFAAFIAWANGKFH